ncbi:MAG: hypothetical protein FD189_545 [Elusimicrobia bacterium]|nr:MAG: hypothetical protein FD154_1198 [Elusimicrobiota bacterium]KAF0157531.1 MAG: hypothetical protein FD189_545 [Elusimicrobiota bacterium]
MRRLLPACVLLSSLAACASPRVDVIQVGPWFQPRHWKQVEVFASKNETRKPWGAIAVMHGERIRGRDERAFERYKKKARRLAADIGADAIIVSPEPVNDTASPGSHREGATGLVVLTGVAFKYAENVSTGTRRGP